MLFGKWKTTAWNHYGEDMEQISSSGDYRHQLFDDWLRPLGWFKGPHPVAQRLRDEGKISTEELKGSS
jgi:hypothetical protein